MGDVSWVSDLLIAGSLATGDYVPGVSDLDLVAVVTRSLGTAEQALLASIHEQLAAGPARGADLGCVYVEEDAMLDAQARHFTWTHGRQVHRILSEVTRAELVRAGFAVFGRPAHSMFPPVTDDDVRDAARSEVCGYWAWASRRPWIWLNPVMVDLGLTSMARGLSAIRTGQLMSKSEAIERAEAPEWLIQEMRARRQGEPVVSPRVRSGWIAWRDVRRTVRRCRLP